jgi:outer membrane protein OmpA-like peptidoglycan-associated protein
MRRYLGGASIAFALGLMAIAPDAAAQTASGFALDRFNPSERGSDWFAADSLDLRGNLRPAIGLVGDYAYRPLVFYNADGSARSALVGDQLALHLGASLNLWSRVRVGFDLPIVPWQLGDASSENGVRFAPNDSAAFGDLRLGVDVRILGEYGDAFTLAVGGQVFVPIGSQSGYLSDGSVRLLPRAQIAGDIGPVAYAANAGFVFHANQDAFDSYARGDEVTVGGSVGLRFLDRRLLIGPEVFASTVVGQSNAFFDKQQTPVEGLVEGHYTVARDFRVGLGAGTGLTRGLGEPTLRILASIEWAPAIAQHEPPPVEPALAPPPAAPSDRDHDGIVDADDACPDMAGERTSDPKTNGCPPPPPDRDHDAIADVDDACPDVAGERTSDPKTNGCPPAPRDRDKDGIVDADDACPDEPGKPSPDPKKNGCPIAFVKDDQIQIVDQVKFATGSAAILPGKESEDVLRAVLGVLKAHPEISKVRIEGYTDNVGNPNGNRALSAMRAASVVAWLAKNGVERSRLSSAGFGADRPIDSNATPEGRQNNRRVEFHINPANASK